MICLKIKNSALHKGISYYRTAIDKFMGNSLISRLQDVNGEICVDSDEELHRLLKPDSPVGSGEWVDLSGLIAPKSEIQELMKAVEKGEINSLEEIGEAFRRMARNYYSYEF